jgi:DNA-binding transcriptional MerR regulator
MSPKSPLTPTFRSGAVARMVQMPVATLRIWEQRYQAVRPATSASGQRLYSSADVQRVSLLRQLTMQGHAIGSLAHLGTEQLRELCGPVPQARRDTALRLMVVGTPLATRLLRPAVAQRLRKPPELVALCASLTEALEVPPRAPCDLLIWQTPELATPVPPELIALRDRWQAARLAVVYRFASKGSKDLYADCGAVLLREPPEDEDLGAWLATLQDHAPGLAPSDEPASPPDISAPPALDEVAPRRFDDATLTAIAGMSPTLACECPRHVAELLMQLSSFERYSAACVHRSPQDAALHAHLQRVAGTSRALFESALAQLALHEGLCWR